MNPKRPWQLLSEWARLENERIAWARLDQALKKRARRSGYAQLLYYLEKERRRIDAEQNRIMNQLMTEYDLGFFD